MKHRTISLMAGTAIFAHASLFMASSALSSGFDNMGIGSMDMLFDPAKASIEFGYTYIDKNVEYKAENPLLDEGTGVFEDPGFEGPASAIATPNAWNYSVNAKVSITDHIDCLGQLNNPGTIEEYLPENWKGAASLVFTDLQSMGLSATCSFKAEVMPGGYVRLIGGGRYIDAQISSGKYSLGEMALVDLQGTGYGWRAGAAFEYPEYAIRASLFYDSAIDLELEGWLDTLLSDGPATADVTMPQGIEFRVQSGVAPKWLVFAGVKWVDWSVLQNLTVNAETAYADIITTRTFNFTDGWTVTAGFGHQLTDKIQVGSAVTWDQGIGGSYSDVYSIGLGGAYQLTDKIKWSLGGQLAYKTGASDIYHDGSTEIDLGGSQLEMADKLDLSYDASWNFGIGTKLKIDF